MTQTPPLTQNVLILGIGNLLWADEGFGVRAVETINAQYEFPEQVNLMDGGTQGIYLIQHIQAADILIVFDAIDYGLAPGTLKLIYDDDVPKFMGAKKMSLHQTGFQEVLSTAELLGSCPKKILLIGVQPEQLEDYGGSLRPCVRDCIEPAIEHALSYCRKMGINPSKRLDALSVEQTLNAPQTGMESYESLRPDNTAACRLGDERILQDSRYTFAPKNFQGDETLRSVNIDHRRKD